MLDFGEDGSGLFMKYLRRGSGYYIDVGASELVADGRIKLKSGVDDRARSSEHSVVLQRRQRAAGRPDRLRHRLRLDERLGGAARSRRRSPTRSASAGASARTRPRTPARGRASCATCGSRRSRRRCGSTAATCTSRATTRSSWRCSSRRGWRASRRRSTGCAEVHHRELNPAASARRCGALHGCLARPCGALTFIAAPMSNIRRGSELRRERAGFRIQRDQAGRRRRCRKRRSRSAWHPPPSSPSLPFRPPGSPSPAPIPPRSRPTRRSAPPVISRRARAYPTRFRRSPDTFPRFWRRACRATTSRSSCCSDCPDPSPSPDDRSTGPCPPGTSCRTRKSPASRTTATAWGNDKTLPPGFTPFTAEEVARARGGPSSPEDTHALRLAAIPAAGGTGAPAAARSASGPIFTAEQAERGHAAYRKNCQDCHGADLDDGEFGGAPLKGSYFRQHWGGGSVTALFAYTKTKMPPDRPGRLSDQTYADIVAFFLSANGFKPGDKELPASAQDQQQMSLKQ